MKNKSLLCGLVLGIALLTAGCASGRPPTSTEQHFFNVTTNYLTTIVIETNYVSFTNTLTDEVEIRTNVVHRTNDVAAYVFSPNTNANAIIETGTAIGNFWGVGGIVATVLGVLFGLWGKLRSNSATKMAGVLTEIIEAGRLLLQTTPQGQKLDTQWVAWMQKHQTETGVILEVAKLLKQVVNDETARRVADELIALTKRDVPKN